MRRGAALAEALSDAASLYTKVDAPQKALDAYHQSLGLREALLRERPGDAAVRRDLGRTYLELVSWLYTLARFDEALAEIARARVAIEPLAREHPGDGGARWLVARVRLPGGSGSELQRPHGPWRRGPAAGAGTLRGPGPGQPPVHPANRGRRAD